MDDGERSSSSSHFSDVHETATEGSASDKFLGIVLNNDLSKAPTWQCYCLFVLIICLLRKPHLAKRELSLLFWTTIFATCFLLKEVTLIPLLTNMIYTRTTYPYMVVIPHCIYSQASYRDAYGDRVNRLHALLVGFLLYGFGGSIVSDVFMGLPVTALAHPRIVPCHILGWLLVWYSPYDTIYRAYSTPHSFFRKFILACEAVDSVTTPMGRIARAARELRNKDTAPIIGGILAGIGGSFLRVMAGSGSFGAVENGFYKTSGYSLLFWSAVVYRCDHGLVTDPARNHCSAYNGSDILRVTFVMGHVIWTLACDAGIVSGHPFVWLSKQLFKDTVVPLVAGTLQLGPVQKQDEHRITPDGKKDL